MNGEMIQYYFFKNTINSFPNSIKNNLEYDDDLLYCLATFSSTGRFFKLLNPFKKDKYKLNDFFQSEMVELLIKDSITKIKKDDDFKELLFIYALESNYILFAELKNYYEKLNIDISLDNFLNMIDYFYALKYDDFDISKSKLTDKFPNGFKYYDYMENIIHNPCIKYFSFFCSNTYFTKSIKRKHFFYKHLAISKFKIKKILYIIYDFIFNHFGKPKTKDYLYHPMIDTRILNLNKDITDNTLDDVISIAHKKCNEKIKILNDYLFNNKEKKFNEIYK